MGARLHLAHPLGNNWGQSAGEEGRTGRQRILADLLRLGRLPESWIAPPEIRELRELVRYRHKVVRPGPAKAQVHGVLAKQGVVPRSDMFGGGGGTVLLDEMGPRPPTWPVESLRDLIALHDREIDKLDRLIAQDASTATRATRPSRPSPGWARSWLRCSWPRSATSAASPGPAGVVGGHDAPPPRVRHHRAPGPHNQARPRPRALGRGGGGHAAPLDSWLKSDYHRIAARRGGRSPRWPSRARSSRSSSTACETARCAVWPRGTQREHGSDAASRQLGESA